MPKVCLKCNCPLLEDEEICIICGAKPVIVTEKEMAKLRDSWEKDAIDSKVNKYLDNIHKENLNVPTCPTCSSTNITKVSTTSKVAGAVAFGLFSKTARSQFKCNNCGYKW